MEEHRAQNLLKELQSLDEATKQKVLVVSTVVIMVVVVFVWVAYFNSIVIPSAVETAATTATTTSAAAPTSTSFWKGLENGFVNIFHGGSQKITPTN